MSLGRISLLVAAILIARNEVGCCLASKPVDSGVDRRDGGLDGGGGGLDGGDAGDGGFDAGCPECRGQCLCGLLAEFPGCEITDSLCLVDTDAGCSNAYCANLETDVEKCASCGFRCDGGTCSSGKCR